MSEFPGDGWAVVIGANGGIGAALTHQLSAAGGRVLALSRSGAPAAGQDSGKTVDWGRIDLTDEASIARAAEWAQTRAGMGAGAGGELRLVVVATGLLHGLTPLGGALRPEKTFRALDGAALLHAYRINAVGPALIAKHFLPSLARNGKAVFAALSARVGSISDNRTGGWHSYRASKAALNMILRNLALEVARSRPEQICVGLHPGTVATGLSAPFQRGVPGPQLLTPETSAAALLRVIAALTPAQSGQVLAWDGSVIPE